MRSCAAAVARVGDFFIAIGKNPPSADTGEYCNAGKKLDEKAWHEPGYRQSPLSTNAAQ